MLSHANSLCEYNKNATLTSTVCFASPSLVQSQIYNPQSAIFPTNFACCEAGPDGLESRNPESSSHAGENSQEPGR